jgi:hypothetical protein
VSSVTTRGLRVGDDIAEELIGRCLREIETGPTGDPGVIVPTEITRGGSA